MTDPTPTRLHFATDHIEIEGLGEWAAGFIDRLKKQETDEIVLVDDYADADRIIFLGIGVKQSGLFPPNHLKQRPEFRDAPLKCYLWSTEDAPAPHLPGLYASLPPRYFDPSLHAAYTYYEFPTDSVPVEEKERDLLYSFVGGMTAEVRKRIVRLPERSDALATSLENFNHSNPASAEIRARFGDLLSRSLFALCPRGRGSSSYRLFEAMRFGAIPVIVSDDFVMPDGPDWPTCSVRIAEKDWESIPARLEELASSIDATAWSRNAREAHREFFAGDRHLANIVRLTDKIAARSARDGDWGFRRCRWDSAIERVAGGLKRRLLKRS